MTIEITNGTKLNEFLARNNISEAEFNKSNIKWEDLLKIGISHSIRMPYLKETAVLLSSMLQQGNEVHSVRWRIKDPEHLMAKIIRKKIEGACKYDDISEENYHSIITDLIGIRVLHLFKRDWQEIHNLIHSMWKLAEKPVIYIRDGDDSESKVYQDTDCLVKVHKAGYRSVHYIINTRPMKDEIFTEIQVRTIFEEAWSEIDHRVRYPNFSNNQLINYFLMIFNRFAGSADEMGSFVLDLRDAMELLEFSKVEISKIENEKKESLHKIDELITKLSKEKDKAGQTSNELKLLKKEMNRLKKSESTINDININNSVDFLKNHRLNTEMLQKLSTNKLLGYDVISSSDIANQMRFFKTQAHSEVLQLLKGVQKTNVWENYKNLNTIQSAIDLAIGADNRKSNDNVSNGCLKENENISESESTKLKINNNKGIVDIDNNDIDGKDSGKNKD
ncbi:addiction module component [Salmonella enterica]|nr:addiction module component [Salmonella enterica]